MATTPSSRGGGERLQRYILLSAQPFNHGDLTWAPRYKKPCLRVEVYILTFPNSDAASTTPLLLSASVVINADDRLAGLMNVGELISSFLDFSHSWSLQRASRRVMPFLLHRLALHAPSRSYIEAHCDICVAFAACNGLLFQMRLLDLLFPRSIISEAVTAAASSGHLDVLEWLYSRQALVCWRSDIVQIGARSGVLEVVRFLLARFPPTTVDSLYEGLMISVSRGCDDITKEVWPQFARMQPPEELVATLLARAPLEIARWMLRGGSVGQPRFSIDVAALRGDLAFVVWAHAQRGIATANTMDVAATHGHLPLVEWLHRNRSEGCTTEAMDGAAAHGHFAMVRWLYHNRVEGCTDQALFVAAIQGHLDIASWLFDMGLGAFPLNTFDHVCANGHLEMAKWLTRNAVGGGTTAAMDWASSQNHLQLVQWLHKNRTEGCTVLAIDAASCHGHLDVVRYLMTHRSEGCTSDAFDHAAGNDHLRVLRWLDETALGVGFTVSALDNAARMGRLDIVQWFSRHPNAVGGSEAALDNAAAGGHLSVVEWLHRHGGADGTSRGLNAAALYGHIHILEFFRVNRHERISESAFRVCVLRRNLHTARWIATYFAHLVDMQVVFDRADANGWTDAILRAAFFENPRP